MMRPYSIELEQAMTLIIDSAIAVAFIVACVVFMMGLESFVMWLVRP